MSQVQEQLSAASEQSKSILPHTFYREIDNNAVFALGLCYIAAPCLIFLASFLRPWIGWPLAVALAWFLSSLVIRVRWKWSPKLLVPTVVLSAALVLLVGIPTGHSVYDWIKHWALINEIANHPWPVSLALRGEHVYLRFYLAAYVCPGLAHKAIPFIPVSVFVVLWFFLGYLLVFRISAIAYERRSLWTATVAMVVPIVLSGADAYVRHAPGNPLGQMHGWFGFHYGNWGTPVEFASGLASLCFVPHQSIPVFLVATMILLDRSETSLARTILAYGLLALWSPYGMIGLLPVMLLRCGGAWNQARSGRVAIAIVLGLVFVLLIGSYLSTDLPKGGPQLDAFHDSRQMLAIFIFLVMELPAYCLLLGRKLGADAYCVTAFGTLVLIPFFHGQTVDFAARAAIGPLFILGLRGTEYLLNFKATRRRLLPVTLAFAICLPAALSEIAFQYEKGAAYRTPDGRKLRESTGFSIASRSPNISAEDFLDICGWSFESQYFTHTKPWILKP